MFLVLNQVWFQRIKGGKDASQSSNFQIEPFKLAHHRKKKKKLSTPPNKKISLSK